ncbi:MAG TPA: hypothetical protein VM573_06970 [Actinomycetota bacterium]|jgi:hypothetical protein|nr:hypothetical protein [Actinomycetota bacterium]
MILAHTLGSGGPEIEMLLIGGAVVVLGVVFFVQKSTKPAVPVVLVLAGLLVAAGSFLVGGPEAAPAGAASVTIVAPEDGATVPAGEPFTVEVAAEGVELSSDFEAEDAGVGHLHVFVDGELVSMPATATPQIELEPGEHRVMVELTQANHASFEPKVTDEITVTAE